MTEVSEFDRQLNTFNEKMHKPDAVVFFHSVAKYEHDDGDIYYFLTDDDKLIKVTSREEERL